MKSKAQRSAPATDPVESAAQKIQEIHAKIRGRDWTESRSLTEEEWVEVKDLITKFSFPCSLGCTPYGFAFMVHDHGPVQGERTEVILFVDDGEFPFRERGFENQIKALRVLEPITHSSRNAEILAWYGFDPLNPRLNSYTY